MSFTVPGFRFAGCAAGIKKQGALDLGLLVADEPAIAAGVFTRNRVRAAPVELSIKRLGRGGVQALLVNSGNANACTGSAGLEAALSTTRAAASALGLEETQVLPASTGVIGALLPAEKIEAALPELVASLSAENAEVFAKAICTTDRWHKVVSGSIETENGPPARVLGIAKGAGMIHPDMGPPQATLLAFLVTDALVQRTALEAALSHAVDLSFNACTVDGDTSTNDTVLALSSGKSGHKATSAGLLEGLLPVCQELARQVVLDGEGAEHAVEIRVEGLADEAAARTISRAVATSLLVKTALFGKDANWGRLLAAAGRAGVPFDPKGVSIAIDGTLILDRGTPTGAEAEQTATAAMAKQCYGIVLTLGDGPGAFTYLTCDLGHGYIDVNAGYRS